MKLETSVKIKRGMLYFKIFLKYGSFKKLKNFLHNSLELKSRKTFLNSKPYILKIEPTNFCNLNCLFCDGRLSSRKRGFMDFNKYKSLIDNCADYVYLLSLHIWGESLLHKEIVKIIEYAHAKKIGTILSSNLNHLDEKLAKELIHSGLDILVISLDGASQESYQRYRKKGSFDTAIKNIGQLVKIKKENNKKSPLIELQCLVMKHNEHELEKLKNLSKKLGTDYIKFTPFYVYDDKYLDWLPTNKKFRFKSYNVTKVSPETNPCFWLWGSLNVRWDGSIVPCCIQEFDLNYGNIFQEPLENIWNNKIFQASREVFKKDQKSKIVTPCHKCCRYVDTHY